MMMLRSRILRWLGSASVLALMSSGVRAQDVTYYETLRGTLRPVHRQAMATWEMDAEAILKKLETKEIDAETREGIATIRGLVASERQPLAKDAALTGAWRVRSLQAGGLGAYVYPYFRCKITTEGRALVFHKNTGSQRKFGLMARAEEGHGLFVGATYYDYEKVRRYSTHLDEAGEEDLKRDEVGHLYQLGKNHLILAFAALDGRWELLELLR